MDFLVLKNSWHKGWRGGVDSVEPPSTHVRIKDIVAVLTPTNVEALVSVFTRNGGEIFTPSRNVAVFGREIFLRQSKKQAFDRDSERGILTVAVDAISCVSPESEIESAMSVVEVSGGHIFLVNEPQSSIFSKLTNDMR